MPVKNTLRFDISDSYYHVYNRGINQQLICRDQADKVYFLKVLERYLAPTSTIDRYGNPYQSFAGKLELLAYCLMDNHFHLLFYQNEQAALKDFMRSIANSYVHYFNHKYARRGPLFESRYKASMIETQSYLEHISRYIHLNPKNWQRYQYSSLSAYLGKSSPIWLKPERILEVFKGHDYQAFMKDYQDHKAMLDEIKYELAN